MSLWFMGDVFEKWLKSNCSNLLKIRNYWVGFKLSINNIIISWYSIDSVCRFFNIGDLYKILFLKDYIFLILNFVNDILILYVWL